MTRERMVNSSLFGVLTFFYAQYQRRKDELGTLRRFMGNRYDPKGMDG